MTRHGAPPGTRVVASALASLPFTLLCVTVLCVLAAHSAHLPAWYTTALAVILAARWWQRHRHPRRVEAWLRIAMLVAVLGTAIAVYGTPLGREPGAAIVCGLLVLKVLESESVRDARMAVGFACFILMSALLFDQSLGFTILVGLMLLPALATLRALQPGLPEGGWLSAFKTGTALLAASLPAALLGFLLIPRLSTPLWSAPDRGAARTGISDRMAPGDLHSLLTDNAVAMRVGFDGAPPPGSKRYFRGMVLWKFDGRAWLPGAAARRSSRPVPVAIRDPLTHYEVSLLPSHRHWMFALDVPIDSPEGSVMGPDHTLWSTKPIDRSLRYRVASATDYRLAPESLDPRIRAAALELPAGFDPRARARGKLAPHGRQERCRGHPRCAGSLPHRRLRLRPRRTTARARQHRRLPVRYEDRLLRTLRQRLHVPDARRRHSRTGRGGLSGWLLERLRALPACPPVRCARVVGGLAGRPRLGACRSHRGGRARGPREHRRRGRRRDRRRQR
jgi:hypothetical protein